MTDTQTINATDINLESEKSPLSSFGSSFNKKKGKKYGKEELLRLYDPTEQYFEGFTIWSTVASLKPLEPINYTDTFKVDKDAVC
jgi:hypothetical protein